MTEVRLKLTRSNFGWLLDGNLFCHARTFGNLVDTDADVIDIKITCRPDNRSGKRNCVDVNISDYCLFSYGNDFLKSRMDRTCFWFEVM